MICKHCGKETANVICDHCGMNVVWYNKYGCQYDLSVDDLCYTSIYQVNNTDDNIDMENTLQEIFIPDGSGD